MEGFLSCEGGVFGSAGGVFGDGVVGIVEQVAAEGSVAYGGGELQLLVHLAVPGGNAGRPEADASIGVPSTMVDPVAAVVGEPVDGEDGEGRESLLLHELQVVAQLWREGLVGVDAENPAVGGQGVGVVFLAVVALPVVVEEACTGIEADGLGGIGGAGVDDDDLIGDVLQRLEATADVAFFVLGDDDG